MPDSRLVSALAVEPTIANSLALTRIPVPTPEPHQVEITPVRVGVCGTDREIIAGDIGYAPVGERQLVIGHELLGRITAVGSDVSSFATGNLVTATVRRPDGCPSCQAGEPDMCTLLTYTERGINGAHGFMAGRLIEDARWVVRVPDELEPTGVLAEPLTVVEKAVRQAELIQRRMAIWELRQALIIGAGPIGILGALLLRSKGVDTWVVARSAAPNPAAGLVTAAGATYISTANTSLDALARQIGGIDLVLESSGSSKMTFEGLSILGNNGVMVLLGFGSGNPGLEVPADAINNAMVVGNKVVVGSVNAGQVDFVNAVARLGTFEQLWPGLAGQMITTRMTLSDDPARIARKQPGTIKSVVEFGSGS